MDKLRITGGHPLNGKIPISGAKNAALPLMAAALLTDEKLVLENIPDLQDIRSMTELLAQHGTRISFKEHSNARQGKVQKNFLTLEAKTIISTTAPYEQVRKMRASILVLGPLLARCGQAKISQPGGCAIGTRPVDLHLKALEAMGVEIELEKGYILARAPQGLKGAEIDFPVVTVTGTENIMMAAALAAGTTRLKNAAKEPEIIDLAECLQKMGAKIEGAGTDVITIHGVDRLKGARHWVVPDRIETGTYAIAVAMTGGEVELLDTHIQLLPKFMSILEKTGVEIEGLENSIRLKAPVGKRLKSVDFETAPFPGYPTDLQAQMMALLSIADGTATVQETIFENRFMHVPELCRMGADIDAQGSIAKVRGVASLTGAEVMATDLRASVSLVLAGLVAKGETILNRVYHLDRGYEKLENKLGECGARIERIGGGTGGHQFWNVKVASRR